MKPTAMEGASQGLDGHLLLPRIVACEYLIYDLKAGRRRRLGARQKKLVKLHEQARRVVGVLFCFGRSQGEQQPCGRREYLLPPCQPLQAPHERPPPAGEIRQFDGRTGPKGPVERSSDRRWIDLRERAHDIAVRLGAERVGVTQGTIRTAQGIDQSASLGQLVEFGELLT